MRIKEELIIEVDNDLYKGSCHFVVIDNTEEMEPYVNSFVEVLVDDIRYDAFISRAVVEESGKDSVEIITCYILTDDTKPFVDREVRLK